MDYNAEIMLIALVAHRAQDGGGEDSISEYTQDIFERFNDHIVAAAGEVGLVDLTPDQRTIIAALTTFAPGSTPEDCVRAAVTTYVDLFAH